MVGKPYYWSNVSFPFEQVPGLSKFVADNGLEKFNSLLCNVYEHDKSKIAPHMDNTSLLSCGEVVSFSFAIEEASEELLLAEMVFSGGGRIEKVPLFDGTRVEFDAFEDASLKRKHEVRSTLHPRLNLTFRILK
jgi:hypothetical protein